MVEPSSGSSNTRVDHPGVSDSQVAQNAVEFTEQAEKLSKQQRSSSSSSVAVKAEFVTPQDPVIVTSDGNRLPGVPLREAHRLNLLREELAGPPETAEIKEGGETKERISNAADPQGGRDRVINLPDHHNGDPMQRSAQGTLRRAMPPSHTNPLFPPLPLYGPPSLLRDMQCLFLRVSSFFLSLTFLMTIVFGSICASLPISLKRLWYTLTFRHLDTKRPFYAEEKRRESVRQEKERLWKRAASLGRLGPDEDGAAEEYPPTEGGKDPIVCDVGYYARRVGLDVEEIKVQTEDGFIIDLWHVYDPKEYTEMDESNRDEQGPLLFRSTKKLKHPDRKRKFPVLLMHGLLQSAGAYCCNDDESLAFWLCKSGFDVWLGNNRCGFSPKHTLLEYNDPRMWCWNIRQMGVFDLPALVSRVLDETGFEKVGLICHSQGTTETLVALAKEQRPSLGEKLTVFCALAPAAYAGSLIGKMYFRFMRMISPGVFRLMFGIHAFIPFMMEMHTLLHPRLYGWLGYKVFSFLFDWSDVRWDRGLRDRMFQFAPVYVSAESMRWWLGRECFARHKCILATKEAVREEERVDMEDGHEAIPLARLPAPGTAAAAHHGHQRGATAWYNEQAPPFALWVCGHDDLVDGRKLLRRFERGREPHVEVVHSRVIPEYEHLDVIWAVDAVDRVFREVREVLWKTCDARDVCRVPVGCEHIAPWTGRSGREGEGTQSSSGEQTEG